MRVFISIFAGFMAVILMCVPNVHASRIAPISQYGQIQNVQNYSSNPLWNPYGPYNQTFPRPVYVDGPDLNSGDCERTVSALVASFCATNNNCHGMQLSDIRPSIMLQLSRLPGHNWATQCMGYIDNAFSEYQSTAQNHVPATPVSFPTATVPSPQPTEYKIKNPFAPPIPDWAKEMQERKQELKQLQSQTSNYDTSVSYSRFPRTYQDLSFAERMQNEQDGYEPYKDKNVYEPITIEKPEKVSVSNVAKQPEPKIEPKETPVLNPTEYPVMPVADEDPIEIEFVIPVGSSADSDLNCESDREAKDFSDAEDDALKQCLLVLDNEIKSMESFDENNCCTFNTEGVCSANVEQWQAEVEASIIVHNVLNTPDCQNAKSELEKYVWYNSYYYPSDDVYRYVSMFAMKVDLEANKYTVFLKYCFDSDDESEYDRMVCHFSD